MVSIKKVDFFTEIETALCNGIGLDMGIWHV
jgi:hypothetical protein